ncbi:MAG: hypothetical protein ACTSUE_10505 [Promethearchaeota archaeon]
MKKKIEMSMPTGCFTPEKEAETPKTPETQRTRSRLEDYEEALRRAPLLKRTKLSVTRDDLSDVRRKIDFYAMGE